MALDTGGDAPPPFVTPALDPVHEDVAARKSDEAPGVLRLLLDGNAVAHVRAPAGRYVWPGEVAALDPGPRGALAAARGLVHYVTRAESSDLRSLAGARSGPLYVTRRHGPAELVVRPDHAGAWLIEHTHGHTAWPIPLTASVAELMGAAGWEFRRMVSPLGESSSQRAWSCFVVPGWLAASSARTQDGFARAGSGGDEQGAP